MEKFILASASPRRRELLSGLVSRFCVQPSRFEEVPSGLPPARTALSFAVGKAEDVAARFPGQIVLGADTVVSLGGDVLGKPRDAADAAATLRRLSGCTHSVFTGICLIGRGKKLCATEESRVTFFELSDALIAQYVASGLPLDKAGSYGIQDGYPLVRALEGSYTNVVGLPVERVRTMLEELGYVETCN